MSGLLPVPVNLLMAMALMMVQGTSGVHEGHGLSKPPDLTCQDFAFVISSSGLDDAVAGEATLAA